MSYSLWPDDIGPSKVSRPDRILLLQAEELAKQTNGLLEGKIKQWDKDEKHIIDFEVYAPGLDRSVRIFQVQHRESLPYPAVFIFTESKLPDYLKEERKVTTGGAFTSLSYLTEERTTTIHNEWIATSPDEFESKLGKMLRSGGVKGILLSLLAEVNELNRSTPTEISDVVTETDVTSDEDA
jgi:hypothetical protein